LTATKNLKLDKHGTHVMGRQNVAHDIFGDKKNCHFFTSALATAKAFKG
jgi:hypothetical protein